MLRRCVHVDFRNVNVPRETRNASPALLENFITHGQVNLPEAPKTPLDPACGYLINECFEKLVKPEFNQRVDPARVHAAALGPRGALSDRKATEAVLWAYFECIATNGYLVENWREELANLISSTFVTPTQTENSVEISKSEEISKINPFDYDAKLGKLKHLMECAGLSIDEDEERIATLLNTAAKAKLSNIPQQTLNGTLENLGALTSLQHQFASVDQLQQSQIIELSKQAIQVGMTPVTFQSVINEVNQLRCMGFTPSLAEGIAKALQCYHYPYKGGVVEFDGFVRQLVEGRDLHQQITELQNRKQLLGANLSTLNQNINAQQSTLQAQAQQIAEKQGHIQTIDNCIADKHNEVANLNQQVLALEEKLLQKESQLNHAICQLEEIAGKRSTLLFLHNFLLEPNGQKSQEVLDTLFDLVLSREKGDDQRTKRDCQKLRQLALQHLAYTEMPTDELEEKQKQFLEMEKALNALESQINLKKLELGVCNYVGDNPAIGKQVK